MQAGKNLWRVHGQTGLIPVGRGTAGRGLFHDGANPAAVQVHGRAGMGVFHVFQQEQSVHRFFLVRGGQGLVVGVDDDDIAPAQKKTIRAHKGFGQKSGRARALGRGLLSVVELQTQPGAGTEKSADLLPQVPGDDQDFTHPDLAQVQQDVFEQRPAGQGDHGLGTVIGVRGQPLTAARRQEDGLFY